MIKGTVLEGVPTIALSIADRDHTAIIDTGFNGDLELPLELHQLLDTRYVGRVTSALAGGQSYGDQAALELEHPGGLGIPAEILIRDIQTEL